jgi:murein DD-endopeptidase MepM/ murein hydrolase activator NlpD
VIVAPNSPGRVKQFRISMRRIYGVLFVAIILSLVTCYGVFTYFHLVAKLVDFESVLTSHNGLKEENLQYREKTRQLDEKLTQIEMITRNISRLTGVAPDTVRSTTGGIGGFSGETAATRDLAAENLAHLNTLIQKSGGVQAEVIRLKDIALEQNLYLSSLPTAWPVAGYISSAFGYRPDPVTGQREMHEGLDISAPLGTKVSAPADGAVLFAGAQRGYGYVVIVAHKYGISTRYAHLSSMTVRVGQRVRKNDILGYVGATGKATGPHLHFEVHMENRPVNPLRFLGQSAAS